METFYQHFEPTSDWVQEEDCDTLLLYLPGYEKKQLRVQFTQTRKLIVSGERSTGDNTWSRFRKQFAVSENCDVNGISAKFDTGILYVKLPKLIMPAAQIAKQLEKPNIVSGEHRKPNIASGEPLKSPQVSESPAEKMPSTVIKPREDEKKNDEVQSNDRESVANQLGLVDSKEENGSARQVQTRRRKMSLVAVLLMVVFGIYVAKYLKATS